MQTLPQRRQAAVSEESSAWLEFHETLALKYFKMMGFAIGIFDSKSSAMSVAKTVHASAEIFR